MLGCRELVVEHECTRSRLLVEDGRIHRDDACQAHGCLHVGTHRGVLKDNLIEMEIEDVVFHIL